MKIALGNSDFRDLINFRSNSGERALYFDKSLMIKDLVDDASKFLLFTRPRRFGKSLNISMLKYFFSTTEDLFSGLEISKYPKIIEKYQGKVPTISLSLKDVEGQNYETMLMRFSDAIKGCFRNFENTIDFAHLTWLHKEYIGEVEISQSFKILSELLQKHYNSPVLILIDEYDTTLNTAYIEGYLDDALKLIRNFFSQTFKDNVALFKGIMTGINRIAKENIFSELNNFKTYDIDSKYYSNYFGFTQSEIDSLELPNKNKLEIKEWYNGYNFGGTTIYNPWSILNYLADAPDYRATSYWSNSGGTTLIDANISMDKTEDLQILLSMRNLLVRIDKGLIYTRISGDKNAFYNLLYNAGYLTAAGDWQEDDYRNLRIVNKEVQNFLRIVVLDWFSNKKSLDFIQKLINYFVEGKPKSIQEMLEETALQTFSFHDVSEKTQESFYHGFILGISLGAKGSYIVKSNHESGYGRYDIAWYPLDIEKNPGILIELKIDNSSAEEALAQINTKKYESDLVQYGCKKIISYGIHADGKKIRVAMGK